VSFAKICSALCVASTCLGAVIGWEVGERIGIAALPPNAWAGDGVGILDHSLTGSGWGALIGFGFGVICCFVWYFFAQWHQSRKVVSQASAPDAHVWPPAPTQRP